MFSSRLLVVSHDGRREVFSSMFHDEEESAFKSSILEKRKGSSWFHHWWIEGFLLVDSYGRRVALLSPFEEFKVLPLFHMWRHGDGP